MKKYLYIIIAGIVVVSFLAATIFGISFYKTRKDVQRLESIRIAYEQENSLLSNQLDESNKKALQFEYKVNELKESRDSVIQKLNNTRKELKIKDKELLRLEYLLSEAKVKDTLYVKDTIFRESVSIDTTLHNKWYDINLKLDYPNRISTNFNIISEKHLITASKKEIVNPSKCGFINLFKKRRTLVEVEVVEKNPYIKSKQNKFIEIVK